MFRSLYSEQYETPTKDADKYVRPVIDALKASVKQAVEDGVSLRDLHSIIDGQVSVRIAEATIMRNANMMRAERDGRRLEAMGVTKMTDALAFNIIAEAMLERDDRLYCSYEKDGEALPQPHEQGAMKRRNNRMHRALMHIYAAKSVPQEERAIGAALADKMGIAHRMAFMAQHPELVAEMNQWLNVVDAEDAMKKERLKEREETE